MTDEVTKRKDRIKLSIAATAIGLGCIGNRIVDSMLTEMERPAMPPVKAPEEPKREEHRHRVRPVAKNPERWVNAVTTDEGRGRG